MDSFEIAKENLVNAGRELSEILNALGSVPGVNQVPFSEYAEPLSGLDEAVGKGFLRVAVIGSIKSGKSTFVNAFFGSDLLKRGAGVVTSIVTRIHSGASLSARLEFKTLGEVNAEIEQALALFPAQALSSLDGYADIRRGRDRQALKKALASLGPENLIAEDARNRHAALISCFVEGYDRVAPFLEDGSRVRELSGDDFRTHKDFVGDENLAAYLKDVRITVPDKSGVLKNVEMADCQGSDSPNPMHLAMIEDYLAGAHLLLYVISSRTGLRRSDIRFLKLLRQMGLLGNTLFILNCDLAEHGSLEDLRRVEGKVRDELGLMAEHPTLFSFSALLRLFSENRETLDEKERVRLESWEADQELAGYSGDGYTRFEADFLGRVTRDRNALILKSHAERLKIITEGLADWIALHRRLLDEDEGSARQILDRFQEEARGLMNVRARIRDTLDGALLSEKRLIGREVDRFFDVHSGEIMAGTRSFIEAYNHPEPDFSQKDANVSQAVYVAYKDLKNALDQYMAEVVNPGVIQFVKGGETRIDMLMEEIGKPYEGMVRESSQRFGERLAELGIPASRNAEDKAPLKSVQAIKEEKGLRVPPVSPSMHYGATVRTEAVIRSGYYSFVRGVKRLFKMQEEESRKAKARAVGNAVGRIKKETEKALMDRYVDFKENLKFQYLYKLLDLAADELYDRQFARFTAFTKGIEDSGPLLDRKKEEKAETREALGQAETRVLAVREILSGLG